jgi:rRNA maturation protein Nop10
LNKIMKCSHEWEVMEYYTAFTFKAICPKCGLKSGFAPWPLDALNLTKRGKRK